MGTRSVVKLRVEPFVRFTLNQGHTVNNRVWINFKELRARLKFEAVLRHYKVSINRKGNQHTGVCPLPNHEGSGTAPSFSANLERGIFQCFSCGAKGNVLEFAALMEGADVKDGDALRKVAVSLKERFFPNEPVSRKGPQAAAKSALPQAPAVITNPPLDFELKGLEANHPSLSDRGFTPETVSHFGLGFCSRGLLKGWLVIPLHDPEARLVGYAGAVVDDGGIAEENPRYRFPEKRERNGKVIEFRRDLLLYNAHRIEKPADAVIVTDDFPSVWWLHQHGFRNVVATMDDGCSGEQARLIVSLVAPGGRVWLLPQGGEAGGRFAP